MEDLLPPGAEPGTVPPDYNQSTGLERLEILGKMQGIDIFDMKPLDASRKGTDAPSTAMTSFTMMMDEVTPVETARCRCGRKTWRGCAGGGWCWFDRTWRKEGTRTESELKEWESKRAIEKDSQEDAEGS